LDPSVRRAVVRPPLPPRAHSTLCSHRVQCLVVRSTLVALPPAHGKTNAFVGTCVLLTPFTLHAQNVNIYENQNAHLQKKQNTNPVDPIRAWTLSLDPSVRHPRSVHRCCLECISPHTSTGCNASYYAPRPCLPPTTTPEIGECALVWWTRPSGDSGPSTTAV